MEEMIKEMRKLLLVYLERKCDCLVMQDETGADFWNGKVDAVNECIRIVERYK